MWPAGPGSSCVWPDHIGGTGAAPLNPRLCPGQPRACLTAAMVWGWAVARANGAEKATGLFQHIKLSLSEQVWQTRGFFLLPLILGFKNKVPPFSSLYVFPTELQRWQMSRPRCGCSPFNVVYSWDLTKVLVMKIKRHSTWSTHTTW